MITHSQARGIAARLERAQQIVSADAVHSIAGQLGTYVVRNGDGTQFYLVCIESSRESCSCPDYQHHGLPLGLPCKHILAAQIVDALQQTEKGG